MAGIIWLASFPKSGNTWLRAFLANYIVNRDTPLGINELPKWKGCIGDARVDTFIKFSGKPRDQLTKELVAKLRPRVHLWMAYANKPDSIFVKTHTAMGMDGGTPTISPEATAGAIYVIRNPFDVAVSYAHHYQISIDQAVEALCNIKNYTPDHENLLGEHLTSWEHHARSWLAAKDLKLHVMRYEDMSEAPIKAFGKLMKFLDVPPDMARVKKAINFSSFDELKKQESKVRFVEARPDGRAEFFRQGKTGGWREKLTDEHVKKLIDSGGEVMRRFGYLDKDGNLTV